MTRSFSYERSADRGGVLFNPQHCLFNKRPHLCLSWSFEDFSRAVFFFHNEMHCRLTKLNIVLSDRVSLVLSLNDSKLAFRRTQNFGARLGCS